MFNGCAKRKKYMKSIRQMLQVWISVMGGQILLKFGMESALPLHRKIGEFQFRIMDA